MVLAELISEYLKSNRRLVVPQIGTFLVKEPEHKILFSTFMKRDDGVLRELLISSGLGPVEVETLMNRLVFEIRFAVENRQSYCLKDVGCFTGDIEGALVFSEWTGDKSKELASQSEVQEDEVPDDVAELAEPSVAVEPTPEPEPIVEPMPVPEPELIAVVEPIVTHQEPIEDEEIEDDEPQEVVAPAPVRRPKPKATKGVKPKKKPDIWIVVAIAVAVIAMCSILYGFFAGAEQDDYYSEYDDYATSYTIDEDTN